MKVWTRLESYSPDSERSLFLAVGNFDGVHRGHQKILESLVLHAKKVDGIPGVLTFSEHPQRVLHRASKPPLLTSPQHRLLFFDQMGIESCFLLPFTLAFSRTSPEEFVEKWLVNRLKAKAIHLGYNAHFGAHRRGDGVMMKELSKRLGFEFLEVEPVKIKNQFVSSTAIRTAIQNGDLKLVEEFLGRRFGIFATVVRGKGRGRLLGSPTANLQPHSEILPPCGVYPVEVRERAFHLKPQKEAKNFFVYKKERSGKWYQGVLNLGVRPTFERGPADVVPEVHLFDFKGDLYGKSVEVIFHPRLREEREFGTSEELVQAIRQDAENAKRYFAVSLYKNGPADYNVANH